MCHKEALTSSLVPSVLLIHNISFPVEFHSNSTNSGFELTAESFFLLFLTHIIWVWYTCYQSKQYIHTKHWRMNDKEVGVFDLCLNCTNAQHTTSCYFLTAKSYCKLCVPTGVNVIFLQIQTHMKEINQDLKIWYEKILTQLKVEIQTKGYFQVNMLNTDPWHSIIEGYKAYRMWGPTYLACTFEVISGCL